ncbi:valine--tRNA ligase [Candidatus Adlerbacteria bacterium RIFCSPHIGHO2_02_FULL_52_17]|uniref:Valine--tRNA ligase n=1 Tax=Candidatus Adlerbacteria bacterium RIFCSPHIGHO2_02_FULL_52_17 TaxID=1797240 RepID=A0A1F4XQH3_9BACT|nr:MAG: valine--tRNA ligase [Candidatus Adlerbacteria bacterium RIFCSPHIGHO2_02_FULL_52_17]
MDTGATEKFKKPYDPTEVEGPIYKKWEESGYFQPMADRPWADNSSDNPNYNKPYTIIMPPPNANGSLHVGHALFVTLQDLLIRFKRMQGYKTLWLPGMDHAGFETQIVYEKKLEKEGRSRFKMEREEFYKETLAFTLENKKFTEGQLRQLGASCDWSREKFTLDPDIIKTVYDTFKKLYDDGLVYRGVRPVNWSTKYQTSLSDLETKAVERKDPLYYLKYGPFVLATVRPETKFGDTAVAVNPNDSRYKEWVGKEIEFDGLIGKVKLKVIADEYVDPEFGTGVVKITPAHDPNDFEVAQRHNLPAVEVIDRYGRLTEKCGKYAGMKVMEARAAVAKDLAEKGLLEKVDVEYTHTVLVNYKNENDVLEPRILPQWFVKMAPLADLARTAVEDGRVHFVSEQYRKIFFHWLGQLRDWNISRQIVWGIPIPAWFRSKTTQEGAGEEIYIGEKSPGEGWERDTDTFDTWFSSGQWPFAALGYPDSPDFKNYYPTSVMETGHDILFFWVMRMIMLGLYRTGEVPFRDVYLHGLVRDAQKQKMSKSKGNVINPLDVAKKYGTDALRMALLIGNTPGTDMALAEEKIRSYKHFANKLWNVARFVLENTDQGNALSPGSKGVALVAKDQECRAQFDAIASDITNDLEEYRVYMAAEKIYHYLWDEFAANILEESKHIFKTGTPEEAASRKRLLMSVLSDSLKLLHPFMPFITEEIWGSLPDTKELLMVAPWPQNRE